jgi:hypothetical protein
MNEDSADDQDEVFGFLADPATHGGAPVKRIDTHAASVFLAGGRALKVKRAVRFPFLDYSTLGLRKKACDTELAVNAPYAPDIYRGVIAITRQRDGSLTLGGDGVAVEWAVDMRRFDEGRTLDHLNDEIDGALAEALGRAVAQAHASAQPPLVDPEAWINALSSYIDEHDAVFAAHPQIFPRADNAALTAARHADFQRILPLLRARRGDVRRIHGDLHLGNIALIDAKPVLFDAIEFSDIIATGDLFYDLAFLLMDLVERGLPVAANIVLNRYLADRRNDDDLDALNLLPCFIATRAAIRAVVTVARLERAHDDAHGTITQSALAYFDLARRAIAPPPPQFIAVGGLSGTGKSQLARMLAPFIPPMPGAVVIRSDVERKALFEIRETDKLPQQAYAAEVTARVYRTVTDKARRVVGAGHSVIADAVFAQARERSQIAETAHEAGTALHGLFLVASLDTRLRRVSTRTSDASDADAAVARRQEEYALGDIDWRQVDASGTPDETLRNCRTALGLDTATD